MTYDAERERKLDAIEAKLARQGKWHSLILAVLTMLALAAFVFLLREILDMRQVGYRY